LGLFVFAVKLLVDLSSARVASFEGWIEKHAEA
jgi:hypothetical protein